MYEVFMVNASGKEFKITGPENGDDRSDRAKNIAWGEIYECVVTFEAGNLKPQINADGRRFYF